MARIIWTDPAVNDLQEIVDYIATDSPQYAARVGTAIIEAIERLIDFPELGRVLPELKKPTVRELITGAYRIVYRRKHDACEIIAIVHSSRDLLRHLPPGPWDMN